MCTRPEDDALCRKKKIIIIIIITRRDYRGVKKILEIKEQIRIEQKTTYYNVASHPTGPSPIITMTLGFRSLKKIFLLKPIFKSIWMWINEDDEYL